MRILLYHSKLKKCNICFTCPLLMMACCKLITRHQRDSLMLIMGGITFASVDSRLVSSCTRRRTASMSSFTDI